MFSSWIKNLFLSPKPDWPPSTLAPAERFYVVGDIHGRLDLLQKLLSELDPDCTVVFVGDYIDRGDQSAQVLRLLYAFSADPKRKTVCLFGNHEDMLLRFLEDPQASATMWMHNGGLQTLTSFGINNFSAFPDEADEVADKLRREIGAPLLAWLQDRPLLWTSGNVTVVHAALDPSKPLETQPRNVCLWGHTGFRDSRRRDGQWVVHGHTIVTDPTVVDGVISVDTGAFATNVLTAAEVSRGQVRFLCTGRHGVTRL